jgi:hypothetical protein
MTKVATRIATLADLPVIAPLFDAYQSAFICRRIKFLLTIDGLLRQNRNI